MTVSSSLVCVLLQPLTPARRHVIRPAAKWSGPSHNPVQAVGHISAPSGGSTPPTSRDAKAHPSAVRPAVGTQTQSSSSGHTQQQPGSPSHTPSQPKLYTNSQQPAGTSAQTKVELHAVPIQTPSTSADANTARAPVPALRPPGGSLEPAAAEPQPSTSRNATHYSFVVASSSSSRTEEKASTSTSTQSHDNPQASASSAQSHARTPPRPSTSAPLQSSVPGVQQPCLAQANEVKLAVLPQQLSIQASALVTQPQLRLRSHNLLRPLSLNLMQGNLIQIQPQLLAQAPAQPAAQALQHPQVIQVVPPAVLIAAAPERLGPLEVGHRIILGSQATGGAVPNPPPQAGGSGALPPGRSLHIRVSNVNSNLPIAPPPAAAVPHNGGEARQFLAPAPDPERVNPAPGLVAVPPAPEEIPRIEDARPGPSAPQRRAEQPPRVRALVVGVVSIGVVRMSAVS